jgi:hypothetical protein
MLDSMLTHLYDRGGSLAGAVAVVLHLGALGYWVGAVIQEQRRPGHKAKFF